MPKKPKLTEKRVRAALALLDNDKNLKLRDVAASFDVSRTELRRRFAELEKSKGDDDSELKAKIVRVRRSTRSQHGSPRKLSPQDFEKIQAILNSGISITQSEVAELFGVSRATIQRYLKQHKYQKETGNSPESTPDVGQMAISTTPPAVRAGVRTRLDALGNAITAEEIDQATRQRFVNAPAAVIADAKRAKDTTIALQVALRDMRLNVPEAGDALDLLNEQANALDNIIAILQSDGDKEAARKTLRDLLLDVLESFLEVLATSGPTKGILATAALAALSLTGVEVTTIVAALVAGPIIGLEVIAIMKILAGWKKKKKDEGQ